MKTLLDRKIFICKNCNKKQTEVGIEMLEKNYYRFNLDTEQLSDFHGDTSVESTKYFCLFCEVKISNKIINILIE